MLFFEISLIHKFSNVTIQTAWGALNQSDFGGFLKQKDIDTIGSYYTLHINSGVDSYGENNVHSLTTIINYYRPFFVDIMVPYYRFNKRSPAGIYKDIFYFIHSLTTLFCGEFGYEYGIIVYKINDKNEYGDGDWVKVLM